MRLEVEMLLVVRFQTRSQKAGRQRSCFFFLFCFWASWFRRVDFGQEGPRDVTRLADVEVRTGCCCLAVDRTGGEGCGGMGWQGAGTVKFFSSKNKPKVRRK